MTLRVLVLGGYGNFGGYVCRALADDARIQLIVAGRSRAKAESFAAGLAAANPVEAAAVDIADPTAALAACRPNLVIHTVGPFQQQDYRVAHAAIACGTHYCDLADARAFVAGIGALDAAAGEAGVAVIAGASSVPCLTAAYLDAAQAEFAAIEHVDYGISAAQQTNRGLGTASAILSYVGRPFTTWRDGAMRRVFGWQGIHSEVYPDLGRRWFGYCDIPDLDLFPARYPTLKSMRFCAGHEIATLHFGTWLLSWLVRLRVLPRLDRWSGFLLGASFLFDRWGSGRSGFHMAIEGKGRDGARLVRHHWMIARQGHGPNIPCMPVILLARKLAAGEGIAPGARPCLDLISLDEYLGALAGLDVSVIAR
ncbi:MAG TPA: saccharopine dehydrogenase NADP-binding domain-containing protein [Croceibacterium sp.]